MGQTHNKEAENSQLDINQHLKAMMFEAVNCGSIEIVQRLLTNRFDPNTRNEKSYTLLHHLIASPNCSNAVKLKIADLLIQYKANVNAETSDGNTPLNLINFSQSLDSDPDLLKLIEFLIKHNADANKMNKQKNFPLLRAAANGCDTGVELLLKYTKKINQVDIKNNTPLAAAVQCASINYTDNEYNKYLNTIKLLLQAGANPNHISNDINGTLLHLVAMKGQKDIARLLIQYGADLSIKLINTPKTPLTIAILTACYVNDFKVKRFFISYLIITGQTKLLIKQLQETIEYLKNNPNELRFAQNPQNITIDISETLIIGICPEELKQLKELGCQGIEQAIKTKEVLVQYSVREVNKTNFILHSPTIKDKTFSVDVFLLIEMAKHNPEMVKNVHQLLAQAKFWLKETINSCSIEQNKDSQLKIEKYKKSLEEIEIDHKKLHQALLSASLCKVSNFKDVTIKFSTPDNSSSTPHFNKQFCATSHNPT